MNYIEEFKRKFELEKMKIDALNKERQIQEEKDAEELAEKVNRIARDEYILELAEEFASNLISEYAIYFASIVPADLIEHTLNGNIKPVILSHGECTYSKTVRFKCKKIAEAFFVSEKILANCVAGLINKDGGFVAIVDAWNTADGTERHQVTIKIKGNQNA